MNHSKKRYYHSKDLLIKKIVHFLSEQLERNIITMNYLSVIVLKPRQNHHNHHFLLFIDCNISSVRNKNPVGRFPAAVYTYRCHSISRLLFIFRQFRLSIFRVEKRRNNYIKFARTYLYLSCNSQLMVAR